jgi:hypothetical protein
MLVEVARDDGQRIIRRFGCALPGARGDLFIMTFALSTITLPPSTLILTEEPWTVLADLSLTTSLDSRSRKFC